MRNEQGDYWPQGDEFRRATLEDIECCLKDDPDNALLLLLKVATATEVDDFQAALDAGQKMVEKNPEDPMGYFVKATTGALMKMPTDEYLGFIQDLMDAKPDNPIGYMLKAYLLFKTGGAQEVEKCLDLVDRAQEVAWSEEAKNLSLTLRCWILAESGDYEALLRAVEKARMHVPSKTGRTLLNQWELQGLSQAGQNTLAVQRASAFAVLDEENGFYPAVAALVFADEDQHALALLNAQESIARVPDQLGPYLVTVAILCMGPGRREAIRFIKHVLNTERRHGSFRGLIRAIRETKELGPAIDEMVNLAWRDLALDEEEQIYAALVELLRKENP